MERSSPLAAMQPPAPPGQWGRYPASSNFLAPDSRFGKPFGSGQANFNFRDLSMKKSSSDYFTLGPMRGSSPTASLAADLSQNFHIDQSPQLPTPRRSLFTSNLFGTLNGRENVVTPPLPSSSPGPLNESMDLSPLPHKIPFCQTAEITLDAPTPDLSAGDSMMLSSPMSITIGAASPLAPDPVIEKKKAALIRPAFHRMKTFSTNSIILRTNENDVKPPPFKFGTNPLRSTASSNTLSLGECFVDSPPQEKKPAGFGSGLPMQARPPLFRLNSNNRLGGNNNSPIVKKPLPSQARPRKQFRRSLSMFESPADMLKEKKSPGMCTELTAIMDVDECHVPKVPHFLPTDRPDHLPRISKDTLIEVLDGKYKDAFSRILIVDCRFEYEYDGGHIQGAINYNDKDTLSDELFGPNSQENTLLILHCEYSVHRAPIMAKFVRQQDRGVNVAQYPKLSYPEMYILDGGYSSFFASHGPRCFPQNYVEMDAKEHARTCEREMGRLRQNSRGKLHRAQTFAFGQHNQIDSSPTGQRNAGGDDSMIGCISTEHSFDFKRLHAKRMASY